MILMTKRFNGSGHGWKRMQKISLHMQEIPMWVRLPDGPPHKNAEESLAVIRNVLTAPECYAVCERENGEAIGSVGLKLNGHTDMTEREDECRAGLLAGKAVLGERLHAGSSRRADPAWVRGSGNDDDLVRLL